ncbi:hypothetical protein K492DRAFT_180828 [Lichtheimia hyalospora FSU 10163]|nr:hypothetical protein K492DRAFT_180828 [Lichtheimia hyalospora FSU 10163]
MTRQVQVEGPVVEDEVEQGSLSPVTTDSMSTSSGDDWPSSTTSPQQHHHHASTHIVDHPMFTTTAPSIYLFIFVNPLSGDEKGRELITLPIQHFRLRRLPEVQVQIHNILDKQDRESGMAEITRIASILDQLPPIPEGKLPHAVSQRHLQVWSAGGDGTVMSVVEMLATHHINLDQVFFSCIPFGTGNDFSQVLGWGRTIPHRDIIGHGLQHLEALVMERLLRSEPARLDIWQVEMTAHASGYVRLAGPDRRDGHDVAEVKPSNQGNTAHSLTRKMCNYMSIGVQGYVGSGFEKHRAGNRIANVLVYTIESAKWVFWRRFPSVTHFIDSIVHDNEPVLKAPDPNTRHVDENDGDLPEMTNHPIDFVIQNIPHIWGREVDLWGEARSGLESVRHRSGPSDPSNWQPQRANDGRMEIMVIQNLFSYFKKLANIRNHVSRLGQFETPFEIRFRDPKRKSSSTPFRWRSMWKRNRYERENVICIMCDGEFYVLKDPKSLTFSRHAQIWTLGRNDQQGVGRLVVDELGTTHSH